MSASQTRARAHAGRRDVAARTAAWLLVVPGGRRERVGRSPSKPGDVVGSKHDLSVSGGAAQPGDERDAAVRLLSHAAQREPARQLWNHGASAATYATYGSSSFQSGATGGTFNTLPGTSARQPTGSARLCLSCHDGTMAVNATLNNGSIAVGGSPFVPATASLGTDLSNDHPVSLPAQRRQRPGRGPPGRRRRPPRGGHRERAVRQLSRPAQRED